MHVDEKMERKTNRAREGETFVKHTNEPDPLLTFQVDTDKSRVARFFFAQHTKTGKNIQNNLKIYQMTTKYTKWPRNIPNGSEYT
jgi:hypothetical protein